MFKIQHSAFLAAIVIFFELTLGYAKTASNPDCLVVADYFTKPIPCVSSWYDPVKRATTFGPLIPDINIVLAANAVDKNLAFDIIKKTRRGPCFGTFRETERLYGGYVVHFKSDPVQEECPKYANHAFLIPDYSSPDTQFYFVLYDGPILRGWFTIDLKKVGKQTPILTSEKEKLEQIYHKIENEMATLHRAKKMADFMRHEKYDRAKPLFDACMGYRMPAEGHPAFTKQGFCLCIAQKFAFGDQLTNEALSGYVQDFKTLLKTKNQSSDVFYPNSINDCESCRYTTYNKDLKGHCEGSGIEIGKYYTDRSESVQTPSKENYTRILKAFLNNDYRSVKKDMLFKNFFVDYIQAYSDWCGKNHIANRVYRKTKKWSEDANTGFQVGLTQTHEIYIDTRYVALFDQYSDDLNHYYKIKYLSGEAISNLLNTMKLIKKEVLNNVDARLVLNDHLNQGCRSKAVQKVYNKLLSFGSAGKLYKNKPLEKTTGTRRVSTGKKTFGAKISIPPKLENPSGLYRVSKRGVVKCRVIKSEGNKRYRVNWNIVTHKEASLGSGQLAMGGQWYPAHQQFYSVPYLFFGKGHSCNGWKKEWANWSSVIVPEIFTTLKGQSFPGYGFTQKSPANRPHGTRSCLHTQTKGYDCRITCTRWESNDRLPDNYLIRDKAQALSLYHYLNTPGSRVTTRFETKAAAAATKAAKEAQARKIQARQKALQSVTPLLSKKLDKINFSDELAISPRIHDFLLARFYPDKLNPEMLQAMMSSRWTYEKNEKDPLGGRFFKQNSRPPTYDELKLLVHYFTPWLLKRAKALPQELYIEVLLDYNQTVMLVKTHCFQFLKHDGSAAGIDLYQVQQSDKKIQECEKRNKQARAWFDRCQKLQDGLKKAKATLAQAKANGCKKTISARLGGDKNGGSYEDTQNLTLANFQTEMMKSIAQTCETPTAGSDLQAYQQCIKTVTLQFKNRLTQLMGQQQPVKKQISTQGMDACETASNQISQIKKDLKNTYCNSIKNLPGITDCTEGNTINRPDVMEIGRINLEQMFKCGGGFSIFHHGFSESAELLPKKRPFIKTQFFLMLYPDNLTLPYDLPPGVKKNANAFVNARIKLSITGTDPRSFRRHQLGLKTKIKDVEYIQQ